MSRPPRSVELHIDELILHTSVPVDGRMLRAAIERELARLVEAESNMLVAGGAARVVARPIELSAGSGADALGAGIAGAILSAITEVRE